jgi:tetratricopeptide (TPR) repeat protein
LSLLPALLALLFGCPENDFDRAKKLEEEGHYREAGELYVDIAKRDPANLAAWDRAVEVWCRKAINVGECMGVLDLELDRLGNLDRHSEALSEVLELRARARIEQGLVDAALDDLQRAEKASPKRASVFVARARAYVQAGKRAPALEALERAQMLDPNDKEIDELAALLPDEEDEGFGGAKTATKSAR